jgi:hypothetical protein
MMLKKIISGGLSVSDQVALDAAIRLGIPHGGYIPWGRVTEIGTLPSKYELKDLKTDNHFDCIEKNVKDSKGTLIISAGKLNDDAEYARRLTLKYSHQLLYVDLELTISPEAAVTVIVEGALLLDIMDAPQGSQIKDFPKSEYLKKLQAVPKTVDEAVDQIMSDMSLEERVRLANYDKENLRVINYSLSIFIRNQLFMKDVNKDLFESCRSVSGNKNLNEAMAALVIIEKLWERLRDTHRLRIIR